MIRAGFGVFFAHPYDAGVPNQASLGFEQSASLQTPDNGITAPFLLANGVPPVQVTGAERNAGFGAVEVGRPTTTNVTFFEPGRRTGYSQQFNLGVQHELFGVLVEAGYLGNLSRKLANDNVTLNQIPNEKMGPAATQRDRPFPQFSNVTLQRPSFAVTDYHAGFAKVERRFSGGASFLASYTWAKNIGNAGPGSDALGDTQPYQDYYNRRLDKGPSELDINHRFTWSSVYRASVWGPPPLADHPSPPAPGWRLVARRDCRESERAADVALDSDQHDQRVLGRSAEGESTARPQPAGFGTHG